MSEQIAFRPRGKAVSLSNGHDKQPEPMRVGLSAMARALAPQTDKVNPFKLPTYAPGVLPKGVTMAMDQSPFDQVNATWGWAAGYHGMFAEGIGFMGYPYLAELTQRSEYRQPSEVMAEEMTRKWVTIKSKAKDRSTEQAEKVKTLTDAMNHYKVRQVFQHALELDGFMGMALIAIDVGTNADDEELKTALILDKAKIKKGSLRGFTVIDPTWIAPNRYNSRDPLDPTFYRPQEWFIMGRPVHISRLMTILSRPVPDMLKPAYNFGGLALSQMLKPYVDNWLRTRQSVSDLLNSFTVFVLETNMLAVLTGGGGEDMENRLALFTAWRNNRGLMPIDKNTESLTNISASLGTLDLLQAQSQEQMAAPARIPLVKWLGYAPSGLNASTADDIRVFYDSIHGRQERVCGEPVQRILDILQLNEFGIIDPDIYYEFNPLWQLDEAGESAVRKTDADTAAVLITNSVVTPDEARQAIAAQPHGPFAGLEGDAPEPMDLNTEEPDMDDPAERIASSGERDADTGANSGV